LIQHAIA